MRKNDLNVLLLFILRIPMYTRKESEGRISSFIHGYQIGTDSQCKFTEKLIKSIEDEYRVFAGSTGWIGQIEQLAEKLESDWVSTYKKQGLKVLITEYDKYDSNEYAHMIKKRILGKVSGIEVWFCVDWLKDWYSIVDLSADWLMTQCSKAEFALLLKIEEELKLYGNPFLIGDEIIATKGLIKLSKDLSHLKTDI